MNKLFFLLMVMLLSLQGCRSVKNKAPDPVPLEPTSNTIKTIEKTIIQKDTIVKTETDSAYYYAFIECVHGKPVLKEPREEKKENSALNVSAELNDNLLKVSVKKLAENLFLQWQEVYLKEHQETETKVPYPVYIDKPVPIPLTWWQDTWIKIGKAGAAIITIYLLLKIPWNRLRKLLPF